MLTLCNGRIKDGPTPVKAPHTRRRLTSRFYLSLLCSNTRRIAIFLVSIPCYSCTSISFSLSLSHLVSFFSLLYIVSLPFYSIVSPVLSISILFFYFHASSFFVVLRSLSEYYSIAPLKSYLSSPFFALRFVLYLYVLLRPPACIQHTYSPLFNSFANPMQTHAIHACVAPIESPMIALLVSPFSGEES